MGLLFTFHSNMPATRGTIPFTGVYLVAYPAKNYNTEQTVHLVKQILFCRKVNADKMQHITGFHKIVKVQK